MSIIVELSSFSTRRRILIEKINSPKIKILSVSQICQFESVENIEYVSVHLDSLQLLPDEKDIHQPSVEVSVDEKVF